MFISDLEFINSCSKKGCHDDFVIKGGAFALTTIDIGRNADNVFATTSAAGEGDYSRSLATTGVKSIAPKNYQGKSGYSAAYASGYGTAYGVDRYSTVVRDRSLSSSIF